MSDPYRPQYYESIDAPENPYSAGPYPGNNSYSHPPSQTQLSRYTPQPSLLPHPPLGSTYSDSRTTSSTHEHKSHRSRSRSHRSRSRNQSRSRSSSRDHDRDGKPRTSTKKALGAAAVGAGVGGFLGHEIGGGALGMVGGILAGAIGAQALEKKREQHKSHRRASSQTPPPSHNRHRRSGSTSLITSGEDRLSDVKDKITGFLSPGSATGGGGRSRSQVDGERRRWGRSRSRDGRGGRDGRRGEERDRDGDWSSEEEGVMVRRKRY